jgi:predicted nucleotidyltransferase
MDTHIIGEENLLRMQAKRSDALTLVDKWVGEVISARALTKEFEFEHKYLLLEFGSTMLQVETANSDIDLIVTTYDALFDRRSFYLAIEKKLLAQK